MLRLTFFSMVGVSVVMAGFSVSAVAQAAPIVRSAPGSTQVASSQVLGSPGASSPVTSRQVIPGVWLYTDGGSQTGTVKVDGSDAEMRVDRGRANVQVHQPAENTSILVDLPGGQVSLIKDGVYTFNAETGRVSVLKGEAEFYPAGAEKAVKIKEDHQYVLGSGDKPRDVEGRVLAVDLLQTGPMREYEEDRSAGYEYGRYGYPYGGYPYAGYGWGSPYGYGWGNPYGYGLGSGIGYFGGFGGGFGGGYFGGYRGGYGGYGGYGGGYRRFRR
jgi:hypothetical protein